MELSWGQPAAAATLDAGCPALGRADVSSRAPVPFSENLQPFFGGEGEGALLKSTRLKKWVYLYSNLSTGGPSSCTLSSLFRDTSFFFFAMGQNSRETLVHPQSCKADA